MNFRYVFFGLSFGFLFSSISNVVASYKDRVGSKALKDLVLFLDNDLQGCNVDLSGEVDKQTLLTNKLTQQVKDQEKINNKLFQQVQYQKDISNQLFEMIKILICSVKKQKVLIDDLLEEKEENIESISKLKKQNLKVFKKLKKQNLRLKKIEDSFESGEESESEEEVPIFV